MPTILIDLLKIHLAGMQRQTTGSSDAGLSRHLAISVEYCHI